MVFCGIDPGISGAICIYLPESEWLEVHDCPLVKTNGKSEMFLPGIINILTTARVSHCVIERSQAMPKQGVSSVFSYGTGYGQYLGLLAALQIPHTRITPQEWKRKLRVPSDKDAARARASELMPMGSAYWMKKTHHGRAEAALLAYFGAHGGSQS